MGKQNTPSGGLGSGESEDVMPRGGKQQADRNAKHMPSPEEIRQGCAEIRAGWPDGIGGARDLPRKYGKAAEVAYSVSVEIDEDEEP